MQKNEVANLHPGWKLSRKCVYDTLMSKRTENTSKINSFV